jgi:antitoxin (DNA-binding transcriptional repressor) of toxin-antitoxin stability system
LRNTRQLKEWLEAGQTIELRERDEVLARILPVRKPAPPEEWPDFEQCAAIRLLEFWERQPA